MKKIYFLGLMGLSVAAFAQQPKVQSTTGVSSFKAKEVKEQPAHSPVVVPTSASTGRKQLSKAQVGGQLNTKIGSTMFIFQTTNAIYRRTNAFADGKVTATWTTSADNGTNGYLSRGSAYNSFDGTTWANSASSSPRVESFRTGYPSITSSSSKEYLISHRVDTGGLSQGLVMNVNSGLGSTTWSTTGIFPPASGSPSQLWPRAVVSGDYLVVAATYQDSTKDQPNWVVKNNVQSPLVYSRYKISTGTWVDQDKTLTGYDDNVFTEGFSDNVSMDANGNNIAIVSGTYYSNLVLWKSSDNGATWTMRIIDTFPVAKMRYDKDTFPWVQLSNGSVHVLVDDAGKAHVFSGLARVKDSILGDQSLTYTYSRILGGINDGIIYWSEHTPDTPLKIIATALPLAGDSTFLDGCFTNADRRYSISNSTWPSAGIDADGTIYLTYSALTPSDVTQEGTLSANYRDILVTYSTDHGATWAVPQNATQYLGSNIEQIYPNTARFVNDRLHLTYLSKSLPGQNVAASNTEAFDINYLSIPVSQIKTNTVGMTEQKEELFGIEQNYPNPFHGSTSVDVNFQRSTSATLTVCDVTGKVIYSEKFNKVPAGKSSIQINTGSIPAGVYFYTVEAEGIKATRRMLVD